MSTLGFKESQSQYHNTHKNAFRFREKHIFITSVTKKNYETQTLSQPKILFDNTIYHATSK